MTRSATALVALALCGCATSPQAPDAGAPAPAQEAQRAPALPRSEADLLSGTRQLIFEGKRSGEGYFSADGSQLIFQSERDPANPFYQIFLMDMETGDTRRVSPGVGKTTCSWVHPSGKKVLFASTHDDPDAQREMKDELDFRASGQKRRYSWDYDEHYEIYEVDLAGGAPRNLTGARGYDAEGSWSPDGSMIAFASNREQHSRPLTDAEKKGLEHDPAFMMDIYIMNADGSGLRRLTQTYGYDGGPFFSPDGRQIIWRRFSEDGHTAEVWKMNIDGSQAQPLTSLAAMSWAPWFHPSGDYVIFTTNLQGFQNFELYLVDAQGQREPVRVTFTEGWDGLPVFTPDGKKLAWSSSRTADKAAQIFIADWNDARARELLAASPLRSAAATTGAPAPAATVTTAVDTTHLAAPAAGEAAISPADLRRHVEALTQPLFDGRGTGTPGEAHATAWVADQLKALGLAPAGSDGYFQTFKFRAGVSLGAGNMLTSARGGQSSAEELDTHWRPLAFSATGSVGAAPVAFAGYGIVAPQVGDQAAYNSYEGLDVKGKWVVVLRFSPQDVDGARRTHLSRYASLRYKASEARARGAVGIVVVSGPRSQSKAPLIPLSLDAASSDAGLAALSLSDVRAAALLGKDLGALEALQATLDSGKAEPGFTAEGSTLAAHIALTMEQATGRNVLARLQVGQTPSAEVVIVGAHVDHLGHGHGSDSLAREDEKGQIHPGADDNASGVAGLIEIAQWMVDQKAQGKLTGARRDVVFAAWSGEELGLLGSAHYVKTYGGATTEPTTLRPAVAAYLNMDMIGRMQGSLAIQGVASSTAWPGLIEKANVPVGLTIQLSESTYLPTDATSFYLKGVPILSAFTGAHTDYHTPRDTADKLNYEDAARIARLVGNLSRAVSLSEAAPDYVLKVKTDKEENRRVGRVYLGTIPDYAGGEVKGLKISGAATGGPAAAAGLTGGDVIVELAGQPIENIYDYMRILDSLKIGEAVPIVVERGGQRLRLTITPGSRE